MEDSATIEDITFDTSYESTYESLKIRYKYHDVDIEAMRRELESLYTFEGLDWTGRGEIKNSEIQGTIAAYQVFLLKGTKEKE